MEKIKTFPNKYKKNLVMLCDIYYQNLTFIFGENGEMAQNGPKKENQIRFICWQIGLKMRKIIKTAEKSRFGAFFIAEFPHFSWSNSQPVHRKKIFKNVFKS